MEGIDADKAMCRIPSGFPATPVSIWKRLYLSILRQKSYGRSGKPGPARACDKHMTASKRYGVPVHGRSGRLNPDGLCMGRNRMRVYPNESCENGNGDPAQASFCESLP
ncbi:hypothetical protein [Gluconobacter sp. Gdi]|uniref:hypothetical protein n=1 Tax=Gluconobacter sp. Gdi TaxID=2691888 RepID=UPI001763E8DB|nr:hypothetical protein [Gluconobacter sp. Gdi]GBR69213.1 hypothetical protein AA103587_1199 [Gluconobacter kanchanaburiensis NBRC 103587]GFE96726.1 hypothetical protein DmGdi_17990 [Gluconobacter sp. Gdi]